MNKILTNSSSNFNSFSSSASSIPDAKVAPIIVGGAIFAGKAIIGGALGAAASWGTTRLLDNRFPSKK
jgi:hypothetical protein